jgi:S1-C subfamily serine protease
MRVFYRLIIILIGVVVWSVVKSQLHGGVIEAGIIAAVTLWAANAVNLQIKLKSQIIWTFGIAVALIVSLIAVNSVLIEVGSTKSEQQGKGSVANQSSPEEEFTNLKKKAEQGDADAQYSLGLMYGNGEGVPKDSAKAFEWFQKAAEQGSADAQYSLGYMYGNGEGVPKNDVKAVEWIEKSAAQGDALGQGMLGYMYVKGLGTAKDKVLAYVWFNLAAAQGNSFAQKNRNMLDAEITEAERTEGQRLASNWKKGDNLITLSGSSKATTKDKPSKLQTGTAFAVSYDGHALTNHHVINNCAEIKIAGREGRVTVISTDSVNDLALLHLPGKSEDIAKLNTEPGKLRQGEDIIVFGYPLNYVLSTGGNLTPGTISALTGFGNNTSQIQITAPIQPGSSGSPVMDKKGNVVAVVSMKLDDAKMVDATGQIGQNVNFAVSGQTVKAFLDTNKVPYKTGSGFFSVEKSNADIADEARKWTVLVECWN